MTTWRYHGTEIDGPGLEPERLEVRGRTVADLLRGASFAEALWLLVTGEPAPTRAAAALDGHLARELARVHPERGAAALVRAAARSGAPPARAILAGFAMATPAEVARFAGALRADERLSHAPGADVLLSDPCIEGLRAIAILPGWLATAVVEIDGAAPDPGWEGAAAETDWVSTVLRLCTGDTQHGEATHRLVQAILVAFQGGFGYLTPTVMLPRMAAGTRVSVSQALAAGFTGAGPAHTGACERAMALLDDLGTRAGGDGASDDDLDRAAGALLDALGSRGERVPGFGHPLFRADPRVGPLRSMADEVGLEALSLRAFDVLRTRVWERLELNPNVDSITAALFSGLGLRPAYGSGLFICSRAGAMLAHIHEKLARPPFGVSSATARQYLDAVPQGWI